MDNNVEVNVYCCYVLVLHVHHKIHYIAFRHVINLVSKYRLWLYGKYDCTGNQYVCSVSVWRYSKKAILKLLLSTSQLMMLFINSMSIKTSNKASYTSNKNNYILLFVHACPYCNHCHSDEGCLLLHFFYQYSVNTGTIPYR